MSNKDIKLFIYYIPIVKLNQLAEPQVTVTCAHVSKWKWTFGEIKIGLQVYRYKECTGSKNVPVQSRSLNAHVNRGNRLPRPKQQRKKFIKIIMDTPSDTLNLFFEWESVAIVTERDLGKSSAQWEGK